MTRLLLLFCIVRPAQAQQDPMDLLRRCQKKVVQSLDRIPRYMCTETIDRSQFDPDSPRRKKACDEGAKRHNHLASSDRLRLDVAMAAADEIYSWVGESKFDDRDIFDIVREGAISNGSFAAFLAAIFRDDIATFTYNGDTSPGSAAGAHVLSEFGFQIPEERSHYYYGDAAYRAITGYDGTFQVDAKTADLVHLEIRTRQLPERTGACYATTTLDYSQVQLKGIDFLLPRANLLKIPRIDGGKAENRTVFSNCHEFLGESTVSFGDDHSKPRSETVALPAAPAFPPKLPFKIAFTQGLDLAAAAAGDPLKAKLVTPIQDGSKVLVPAGAALGARIVRIWQYYGKMADVVLELKLETVNIKGIPVPFTATPSVGTSFTQGKLRRRVELGTLHGLEDRSASFLFRGKMSFLAIAGLESDWLTASPAK